MRERETEQVIHVDIAQQISYTKLRHAQRRWKKHQDDLSSQSQWKSPTDTLRRAAQPLCAGTEGYGEIKLFYRVTGSVQALRPGLVRCLPRTYGDLGDLAKCCSPDRAVSPGIDISEELSEAGRS